MAAAAPYFSSHCANKEMLMCEKVTEMVEIKKEVVAVGVGGLGGSQTYPGLSGKSHEAGQERVVAFN